MLDVAETLDAAQSVVLSGDDVLHLGDTAAAYGTIGGFAVTDTIDVSLQHPLSNPLKG